MGTINEKSLFIEGFEGNGAPISPNKHSFSPTLDHNKKESLSSSQKQSVGHEKKISLRPSTRLAHKTELFASQDQAYKIQVRNSCNLI